MQNSATSPAGIADGDAARVDVGPADRREASLRADARRSRSARERSAGAKTPPPGLELAQRRDELLLVEVRPEHIREVQLGVGGLPQQVVREPVLAAGADHQIGVGHVGRVEQRRELFFGLAVEAPRGVEQLGAAAVVERDVELQAVAARPSLRSPSPSCRAARR